MNLEDLKACRIVLLAEFHALAAAWQKNADERHARGVPTRERRQIAQKCHGRMRDLYREIAEIEATLNAA